MTGRRLELTAKIGLTIISPMNGHSFNFVQFSDTHVFEDRQTRHGCTPDDLLVQMLEDVKEHFPHRAFMVHTGDVGGLKGTRGDFHKYAALMRGNQGPVHHLPGNHDLDKVAFRAVVSGSPPDAALYWSFQHESWTFVGLDSSKGSLDGRQMRWLKAELATHSGRPIGLFLHHHVIPVGVPWLDRLALDNRSALLKAIDSSSVRFVANGHVHMSKHLRHGGRSFLSLPSLSWQFDPAPVESRISKEPPGYRVFEISEGGIRTWVRRLAPDPYDEKVEEIR